MDERQRKEGGEAASLSTTLSKFTDLFESFANELLAWRNAINVGVETKWKEYFGNESPSFAREIDETNLVVLERHLKMLTLLMEIRLEELAPGNDETSITSEKATTFRTEAEVRLMELYDRIKRIKARLQDDKDSRTTGKTQSPYSLDLITEREEDSTNDHPKITERVQDMEIGGTIKSEEFEVHENLGDIPPNNVFEDPDFDDTESPLTDELSEFKEPHIVSADQDFSEADEAAEVVSEHQEKQVSSPENHKRVDSGVDATPDVDTLHGSVVVSDQKQDLTTGLMSVAESYEIPEETGIAGDDTEQMISFVDDSEAENRSVEMEAAELSQNQIETLTSRLQSFKKVHNDENDLKVKSSSGSWTLSLPYFVVTNGSGNAAALLDLESFIRIHKLAVKGVLDAAAKSKNPQKDPKIGSLIQKLQGYLAKLYFNIHKIIAPQGQRFLPETGEMIDSDIFLMLETDINLDEWKEIEDVANFQEIFVDKIVKPFQKYISIPENKVHYLKSIIEYGYH